MSQLTFISNKTKKETYKYLFVVTLAIASWLLQVSIFSRFLFFDTSPNLMFLGCIYLGIRFGSPFGTIFGLIASFLCASTAYDHTFYFSYPLCGFVSGLLTKNVFLDELLFCIFLSIVLIPVLEFLNSWQYSFNYPINLLDRLILVTLYGIVINIIIAPIYYLTLRFITKKLNLW